MRNNPVLSDEIKNDLRNPELFTQLTLDASFYETRTQKTSICWHYTPKNSYIRSTGGNRDTKPDFTVLKLKIVTNCQLIPHQFTKRAHLKTLTPYGSALINKWPKGQRSLSRVQCAKVKSHFKKHINGPWIPEAQNRRPSFYACPGYQQL